MAQRKRSRTSRLKRKTQQTIAERLVDRIRARADNGGVFTLDLRGKAWAGVRPEGCAGFLTLRNPGDEGWPNAGRTTTDPEVAESWVRGRYAEVLGRREAIGQGGPGSTPTVEEACLRYLERAERRLGARHNTVVNRRSACDAHLIPGFGPIPLDALSKAQVRKFLEELRVRKWRDGVRVLEPAKTGTKSIVRDALHAVWRDAFPDDEGGPPFGGILLDEDGGSRGRREAALAGEVAGGAARAYTPEQILHLLAAATRYDREVMAVPRLRGSYFPNVAPGLAFILGTMARIEESTFVRWRHVDWEAHAVYVPGTKSRSAPRWIPLLDSLRPWLMLQREVAGGEPHPDDFVLRLRRGGPIRQPSKKTWGGRITRVERIAGLKLEQKAAHILRGTHISLARDRLPEAALKSYAGHTAPRGGATDAYVDTRPPFIPPEHRTYLALPTPEEVAEYLRGKPPRP